MPGKKIADRLRETIRLPIQNLNFENSLITVCHTKSNRDRLTFLPNEERSRRRLPQPLHQAPAEVVQVCGHVVAR